MERFKGSVASSHAGTLPDLHSNMERFKEITPKYYPIDEQNLHSNMERFKEQIKTENKQLKAKFTFQYGEI